MSDELTAYLDRLIGGSAWADTGAEAAEHIRADVLPVELAAAERRGYDRAVANLRDGDRFVAWAFKTRPDTGIISDVCADYLEATKETDRGL